ncbi:MAG: secretin N-terminal domain-containing protein [Luteolibacter sp.]
MKAKPLMLIAAGLLIVPLHAQPGGPDLLGQVQEAKEAAQAEAAIPAPSPLPEPAPLPIAPAQGDGPAIEATDPAPAAGTIDIPAIEVVDANGEVENGEEPATEDEGFIIKDAGLNDILQYLAKSAGKQYFHNAKIAGPEYLVTGHLNDGDPLQQMEELAFMYGLSLHHKGNTIYALTQSQLGQLPSTEYHYQLRYLRPTDVETIKDLIRPVLSPGTGIVNFEPKTNTIIIIDTVHRIEAAQRLLQGIDRAKGQIIVETKILRVNSSAAERTGVNWETALGGSGDGVSITSGLNAVFGFDAADVVKDANLILAPGQLTGVLRALAEGNLASQISNPTLITEDNERATISIIDRIPIITTTTTASSTGADPTVTEEVRYKVDQSDQTIDQNPEQHREIGISLVVTPTLLPDGTVRMKMRPRSAQITGRVVGQTDNEYPQVTESMIETLARIPDGHSLVVGGFYGEVETDGKNKVPLLGDVPVLNFFFKSKETIKEKTSLVFIVTPTSYDPSSGLANSKAGQRIRASSEFSRDYNWVDPDNPGPAHETNLSRALRGLQPHQAPFYPRATVVDPSPDASSKR